MKSSPLFVRPRRRLGIGLLVAASLTTAACGSDGAGGADGDALKVGISVIQSGPAASSGLATKCGLEAYLDRVNADGGVNGHQLELVSRDNQYDPSRAANIAREMAGEGVFALVTEGTATMKAAIPPIKTKNIALFASADGDLLAPPEYDALYGLSTGYGSEAAGAANFISDELGFDKASLVYLNSEAGEPAAREFPAAMEARGGTVATAEAIAATATDYAAYAESLKSANAPVVYSVLLDTQLSSLQKATDAIGYRPTWVSWPPAWTPSYLDLAGPLAEGVYVTQYTLPAADTREAAVKEYNETIRTACPDRVDQMQTKLGWTYGAAIVDGVSKATEGDKAFDQDAFLEALERTDAPVGMIPSITWTDEVRTGATKSATYQIKDGKLRQVVDFTALPSLG